MFDAIVIGSGMSGGIAAKELCERGLKGLVIERGRKVEHGADYTDSQMPWELPNNNMIPEDELARDYPVQRQCYAVNEATKQFWVKDSEHPYTTPEGKPLLHQDEVRSGHAVCLEGDPAQPPRCLAVRPCARLHDRIWHRLDQVGTRDRRPALRQVRP